jgi:hypothetical protein
MKDEKITDAQPREGLTPEVSARKITFGEQVTATIKILGVFGLLGAALWGIELWVATN